MMHPLERTHRSHGRARLATAALGSLAIVLLASGAAAQRRNKEPESLHGSKASVEKMYDFAQRNRFPFYLTPATLDAAIASGKLVALTGDSTYELTRGVGFSYATREAKQFIQAFAPQYLAACGAPLTVTSAARPMSRQPHNANPHSVHPTGIAVDIRRPSAGPCLDWVRSSLADLEARGIVEATEEHHPVHLHVAVLAAPGRPVTLPDLTHGVVVARLPRPTTPVAAVANGDVALMPAGAAAPTNAAVTTGWAVHMYGAASTTAPTSKSWATPASGAAPPSVSRTGDGTYVVRQGDTLWDVAQKTGVTVQALAAANDRSPRRVLRPGTVLRLPRAGGH